MILLDEHLLPSSETKLVLPLQVNSIRGGASVGQGGLKPYPMNSIRGKGEGGGERKKKEEEGEEEKPP